MLAIPKNLNNQIANYIFVGLIAIFPVGILIIRSWMSSCLFLAFILSTYLLIKTRNQSKKFDLNGWSALFLITMILPLITIFVTQAIRNNWHAAEYDSPSRFLLVIPVFFIILKENLDFRKYWQYTFAAMLIITLIAIPFLPKTGWVALIPDRLTTYFVNQIFFGRICLTFGLLSLLSINLIKKDSWQTIIFKLIGVVIGFYLSIKSETRSIWIVIPIVFLFFIWLNGPKKKIVSTTLALIVSTLILGGIYKNSLTVEKRINEAVQDISSYKLNEMNPDTSIGIRISSARMAWYYFKLRPLAGWGDKGFKEHLNDPEISVYASEYTRNHPFLAGFHNEFTNSAVKYGILGFTSTILLFLAPLMLFIYAWTKGITPRLAAIGVTYVLCELAGSLTLEIFDLKFTTSLYALFVTCLMGSVLSEMSKQNLSLKVLNK